jgi:cytochrome c oxidase subunit 2
MASSLAKFRHLPTLLLVLAGAGGSGAGDARAGQKETAPVEIKVTARQFEFEPRTITVHKGEPVRLAITSEDVDHGFAVDEFKINKRIKAGAKTVVEFTPDREGKFRIYCSVVCGDGHDKMVGELVVTKAGSAAQGSNMRVTFDETPGVVFVESGGQRIKIDTRSKTVVALENEGPPAEQTPTAPSSRETRERRAAAEPYDYRLINVPTPKRVPRHSLNFFFTHRFQETFTANHGEDRGDHLSRISNDLLGLDSFSVSSFGVSYGITDRLYALVYRSPLTTRGTDKTIELGLGYHLLDEAGKSPVALSVQTTIEGENNFTERYTENIQAMLERSVTHYVHLFFSPAVHINANAQGRFNPRPDEFFPPAPAAATFKLGQHTGSFGFGADARIRPSVSLLFEFTPRIGFKMGQVVPIFAPGFTSIVGFRNNSEPEIGFGIEKRLGRHVFTLTFSNTQATTTSRYNSSNLLLSPSNLTIGFNLFRRLL